MSLKNRVFKIEQRMGKPGKAPVEFACIYIGDSNWKEKEKRAIEKYREKFGCLDNLRIVHTHCPEPLPLPERLRPAQQSI
jgi:hypothetical protein